MLNEMIAAKKRGSKNSSVTPWERQKTEGRREAKKREAWVAEFAPIVGRKAALRALDCD